MENSKVMDLSIRLTVQSKQLVAECNRYKREASAAATELRAAARRRDEVAVMMAAQKQANAQSMHTLYARLGVQLSHAAGLVRTAAITGRISGTLSQVTLQLSSAAGSLDAKSIEARLSDFHSAMASASDATARMDTALGALGASSTDSVVRELIAQASEEAGIELCTQFMRPPSTIPDFSIGDDEELLSSCKPAAL